MTTISTLTLTGMLQDPLIKLVMRSDGVSDEDFSALLYRVKDTMIAQGRMDGCLPSRARTRPLAAV